MQLDPIEFREAIVALQEDIEERRKSDGDFRPSFEYSVFFFSDWWPAEGDELADPRAMSGCARFQAFLNLVKEPDIEMFARPTDEPGKKDLHAAALEAAAICPLNDEGLFDKEAFLKLVEPRKKEIEIVAGLLPDEIED